MIFDGSAARWIRLPVQFELWSLSDILKRAVHLVGTYSDGVRLERSKAERYLHLLATPDKGPQAGPHGWRWIRHYRSPPCCLTRPRRDVQEFSIWKKTFIVLHRPPHRG